MHSFKTRFSSPFDSYINGPTAHVCDTAKHWTVCFYSGLFLQLVWHPTVLGWPLNGPPSLDKQTADSDSPHDWLMSLATDLTALCDMWRWKWHQWMPFGWRHSLCLPLCGSPPASTLPPYNSSSGSSYTSKTLSKMMGNSANYPVYSRYSELPWIAISL